VVIGNITVGGTGKTPLLIHLVHLLQYHKLTPVVVSRGYKAQILNSTDVAQVLDDPIIYGDEPVLIAKRAKCPVIISKSRVKAIKYVEQQLTADIILSDDGLQHYAMARDIELCIIDKVRKFGNNLLLPLGPMREPKTRLATVDLVINEGPHQLQTQINLMQSLKFNDRQIKLSSLQGTTVHAVAGIANPDNFFNNLREFNINLIEHKFIDHHKFTLADITFKDDYPVLMTEKDAQKCMQFANAKHWYVPLNIFLPVDTLNLFLKLVAEHLDD
jgi:tetraacyldisaccharide 4'-kinase